MSQFDNEPKGHDAKAVLAAAQDPNAVYQDKLAHLVKLILDAQTTQ